MSPLNIKVKAENNHDLYSDRFPTLIVQFSINMQKIDEISPLHASKHIDHTPLSEYPKQKQTLAPPHTHKQSGKRCEYIIKSDEI